MVAGDSQTLRNKRHFVISVTAINVVFTICSIFVLSGSLLPDDPGCGPADEPPEAGPDTLHILPRPTGSPDQDECH